MKKNSAQFDKFAKRKSNAAIKEQFKQEKRKWKKEREDFFEKKRNLKSGPRIQQPTSTTGASAQTNGGVKKSIKSGPKGNPEASKPETGEMPLNKFIAHCG